MTVATANAAKDPMSEYIPRFLAGKPLAKHTKRDYQRYLERYDAWSGGGSLGKAMSVDLTARWITEMVTHGLFAANNATMALKSFSAWLAKSRLLQTRDGDSLLKRLAPPELPKSNRRAFTDEEMDRIWSAVRMWHPDAIRVRALTFLRVAVGTGMRRNEIRQIALSDLKIDWEKLRGVVRVRAETSKGAKDRVTRLDPEAIRWLDRYLHGPVGVERPSYVGDGPEPVFLTRAGDGFTEYGWSTFCDRVWKEIKKDTGIVGSSHMLRHTWATNYNRGMRDTGNSIYDMQREGGWANPTIPRIYCHDRPEDELFEMQTPAEALQKRRDAVAA